MLPTIQPFNIDDFSTDSQLIIVEQKDPQTDQINLFTFILFQSNTTQPQYHFTQNTTLQPTPENSRKPLTQQSLSQKFLQALTQYNTYAQKYTLDPNDPDDQPPQPFLQTPYQLEQFPIIINLIANTLTTNQLQNSPTPNQIIIDITVDHQIDFTRTDSKGTYRLTINPKGYLALGLIAKNIDDLFILFYSEDKTLKFLNNQTANSLQELITKFLYG